jgi:hypothetical protein
MILITVHYVCHFNTLLSFVDVHVARMGGSGYFSEFWRIQRSRKCEIVGAHSYMTLYIVLFSFVDGHIFETGGFSHFSLSYDADPRGLESIE